MRIIALLLVAFVALSHVGFLVLEMFYWNEPVGREIFNTTPEFTASTAVLAANQGLCLLKTPEGRAGVEICVS